MTGKALILGASGSFGRNCALAFAQAGWRVRRYKRGQESMVSAATGMDVIVNGLNPPNYKGWVTALPRIAREVTAAAKQSGASVIQPGNVYNYGAHAGIWDARTPHRATTKKGKARIEMEQILRASSHDSDVQVIILRAGDFIDNQPSGNFIDFLIGKLGKGRFIYPGGADINHAWAYLPDMARAVVALAETRATLDRFEDVPFAGHTLTGAALRAGLSAASGKRLKLARFPWRTMKLLSPVWPLAREMQEMRYLWDLPHALDGARLAALLVPALKPTASDEIFRRLVAG